MINQLEILSPSDSSSPFVPADSSAAGSGRRGTPAVLMRTGLCCWICAASACSPNCASVDGVSMGSSTRGLVQCRAFLSDWACGGGDTTQGLSGNSLPGHKSTLE